MALSYNEIVNKIDEHLRKSGKRYYSEFYIGVSQNAVKRLFEVKQRPLNKPISLLVSNMEMVNLIAKDITEIEYKIMEKFFPGPLTIILKKFNIAIIIFICYRVKDDFK